MGKTKKSEEKKPLDSYLERDGDILPKTIRATDKLWIRVEQLAEKKNISVNLLVVCALEKVCDEEGIA